MPVRLFRIEAQRAKHRFLFLPGSESTPAAQGQYCGNETGKQCAMAKDHPYCLHPHVSQCHGAFPVQGDPGQFRALQFDLLQQATFVLRDIGKPLFHGRCTNCARSSVISSTLAENNLGLSPVTRRSAFQAIIPPMK